MNLQLSGFFKGMYYPLLSAGALNSLFFGVYGVTLRAMTENRGVEFFKRLSSCLKDVLSATCIFCEYLLSSPCYALEPSLLIKELSENC